MKELFANRTHNVPRSFIREILKVTDNPAVISFAGGLPNPQFFPVTEIAAAAAKVLHDSGESVLQYSTTEGYLPLREYIANRYLKRAGLKVDPAEILITNGSQQCLDLLGKVFINTGDTVMLERPAYLGAIQAFSMYEPEFKAIPLLEDGIDLDLLEAELAKEEVKLFYSVPNFQNPSGISYSKQKRVELANHLTAHNLIYIEDDPYGELRFVGEDIPPVRSFLEKNSLLLGSFSKIVAPGLRLGWIYAPAEIMEKLITAKQGSDLHSNFLAQRVVCQYLMDNNIDEHIQKIKGVYKKQRDLMLEMIFHYCPPEVHCTKPEGGMFIWMTLPEKLSALDLFELAIQENVAFVPGHAFYTDGSGQNTLRLNFSNSDELKIETGIKRLGKAIKKIIKKNLLKTQRKRG